MIDTDVGLKIFGEPAGHLASQPVLAPFRMQKSYQQNN